MSNNLRTPSLYKLSSIHARQAEQQQASMSQKYDPPNSPPPPAYGTGSPAPTQPQPAHVPPQTTGSTDMYGASPYQHPSTPQNYPPQNQPYHQQGYPPQAEYANGYPPPQQQYGPNGGYYAPGPQMGYAQQPGYYQQGPGYGGYGGYGRPQGQYVDDRRGGGMDGFMGALLGSLACCCCLDACLLF